MHLTSRFKNWGRGLGACAAVFVVLTAPAAADSLAKQRADFVAAERALQRGDSASYIPLRQGLQDYPLFPYLEYGELRTALATTPTERVQAFIRDNADSPLSGSLRRAWLGELADQGRWQEFLAAYDGDKSLALRCDQVRALLGTGQRSKAFALLPDLWRTGDSLPSECDGPLADWRSAGGLTNALVWERFRLAMDEGNDSLARFLMRDLPAGDQAWAERWLRLRDQPQLALNAAEFGADHPARDDMLSYAVRRMARQDAPGALDMWNTLRKRHAFSREATQAAEAYLAPRLVREDSGKVADFMRTLRPADDDAATQEARIRSALLQHRWALVARWIDDLPATARDEERWLYWRARAHEALGESGEARALYSRVAGEPTYYGFLAADRAGVRYAVAHRPATASAAVTARVRSLPAMRRVAELRALGRDGEAAREWRWQYDRLSPEELKAAARIAKEWGWHDQAAYTLAKADYWDDHEIRFPILYRSHLDQNAAAQGIDASWVYAVVRQESTFNPEVRSHAGATGLMQLMPATATHVAQRYHGERAPTTQQLTDPARNVRLGTTYLRVQLERLYGNPVLATAAYNAGPGNVRKWLPAQDLESDVWVELIPFKETQDYVRRVMAYAVFYDYRLGGKQRRITERMPPIAPPTSVAESGPDSGPGAG
jgi:soluble lytic murein transglycosylase